MNIECFIVTKDGFEEALLPKTLLLNLADELRSSEDKVLVEFSGKNVLAEGLYIPARNTKTKLMLLPDDD